MIPKANLTLAFSATSYAYATEPAIITSHETVSYSSLEMTVAKMASGLVRRAACNRSLIATCLKRTPDAIAALLACLRVGAACLPLDPDCPDEWLVPVLEDTNVATLIVDSGQRNSWKSKKPSGVSILTVDQLCNTDEIDDKFPGTDASPHDRAIVVLTSGSTGRPKAVELTHGNLLQYVEAFRHSIDVSSSDFYLHTAPFSFSSSNRQILVPLLTGATIILAQEIERNDPVALVDLIEKTSTTIVDLVPSHLVLVQEVFDAKIDSKSSRTAFANLRLTLTASEPLTWDIATRWLSLQLPAGHNMVNMYGTTETTGIVCSYSVDRANQQTSYLVPIGFPFKGVEIALVDKSFNPVADGEVGELSVSGPTVACYQKGGCSASPGFVTLSSGKSCFRTGDRGRRRPDGIIEFLGREDNFINLHGVRIEPGFIEEVLTSHPDVREAAVLQRDWFGYQTVVAFAVACDGHSLDTGIIRKFLMGRLPKHLIPGVIAIIPMLPRTRSGKIARAELLRTLETQSVPLHDHIWPISDTEKMVLDVWREVLNRSDFPATANFYDLGGNSFKALLIRSRIKKKTGLDMNPARLMRSPTVRELAEWLDATQRIELN